MGRLLLLGLLLAGCGEGGGSSPGSSSGTPRPVLLQLLHRSCVGGTADLLPGADGVAVRVSGPGLKPLAVDLAYDGGGRVTVPDVPSGADRVFEVDVTTAGERIGWGISAPTEVPADGPAKAALLAYPVHEAVRAGSLAGRCAVLATGRAGLSIALLADGRVLAAGGYTESGPDDPGGLTATAELLDPRTGEVTQAAACEDASCARAYGPAVPLPDGDVLIAGGLIRTQDGKPDSSHALIYDPAANSWKSVLMNQARRFNTATTLSKGAGKVLVVGGVGDRASGGPILDTTEIYDPKTSTFSPGDPTDEPVARHSAILFTSRDAVGIAGGITTNQIGQAAISGLVQAFDPSSGGRVSASALATPVAAATVVRLGDLMLIAGGATDWAPATAGLADGGPLPGAVFSGWQTWAGSGTVSTHDSSTGSTFGCGATLDRTRSWLGGGLNAARSPLQEMKLGVVNPTPELVDVTAPGEESMAQALADRRADLACTRINDHQLLIAGGWGNSRGGANRALDTLEIFTY